MTSNKETNPLSDAQLASVDTLVSAQGGYYDSLLACVTAGILSAMFDPKHDAFTTILGRYAAARLSGEDVKTFTKGKGATGYNGIRNRLTTAMKRAARDLAAIETESAMTGEDKATVAKGKAVAATASKAGKAGTKRDYIDLQMDALQAIYNRAKKDQVSDSPAEFDHVAAFGFIHSLADLLGKKLKEPELPK